MTQNTNPDRETAAYAKLLKEAIEHQQTAIYKERLRFQASDARARYLSFLAAGFDRYEALALTIGKPL